MVYIRLFYDLLQKLGKLCILKKDDHNSVFTQHTQQHVVNVMKMFDETTPEHYFVRSRQY